MITQQARRGVFRLHPRLLSNASFHSSLHTQANSAPAQFDPSKKHLYRHVIDKKIEQRKNFRLPSLKKLAHRHTWDVNEFKPFILGGKSTNLFLLPHSASSHPPITPADRIKEAEERVGHKFPEDYKSFLQQMDRSAGVKVPAHLWDKNSMVVQADDTSLSDSLEELYHANKVELLSHAVGRWIAHSSGAKTHKWQGFPAVVIGSFAFRKLCLFLADHEGYKKGSIYSYRSGNFEDLKFVADSFTDFCNRLFTEEQEEEYHDSIEKLRHREEERKRHKRSHNPKNDEYTDPQPKDATNLHRYHINQRVVAHKKQQLPALSGVADKYEWKYWDWKYLRFGEKYTKVHIYEDQHRGLSNEEIDALEKEVKGKFPKDYRQFLSEYDGVYLKPPAHTWAKDGHVAFDDNLYHIYGSDNIKTLDTLMDEKKELFDPSQKYLVSYPVICIAGDTFFPRVIMFVEDQAEIKKGSVWALIYGQETIKGVKPIADSFTEYCNSFLTEEEEEHYYAAKMHNNK